MVAQTNFFVILHEFSIGKKKHFFPQNVYILKFFIYEKFKEVCLGCINFILFYIFILHIFFKLYYTKV